MSRSWTIWFYSEKSKIFDLIETLKISKIKCIVKLENESSEKITRTLNTIKKYEVSIENNFDFTVSGKSYEFHIWSWIPSETITEGQRITTITFPSFVSALGGPIDPVVLKMIEYVGKTLGTKECKIVDSYDSLNPLYICPWNFEKFKQNILPNIEYGVTAEKKKEKEYALKKKYGINNENKRIFIMSEPDSSNVFWDVISLLRNKKIKFHILNDAYEELNDFPPDDRITLVFYYENVTFLLHLIQSGLHIFMISIFTNSSITLNENCLELIDSIMSFIHSDIMIFGKKLLYDGYWNYEDFKKDILPQIEYKVTAEKKKK